MSTFSLVFFSTFGQLQNNILKDKLLTDNLKHLLTYQFTV